MRSLALALALWIAPAAAQAASAAPWVRAEGGVALLTERPGHAGVADLFGLGLAVGLGGERWGAWVEASWIGWLRRNLDADHVDAAATVALGGEWRFADGLLATGVALGTATLVAETDVDPAGATGIYGDLRPLSLRWAAHRSVVVGLTPLTVTLIAPVLSGRPLVKIRHRTILFAELSL